MKLEAIRLQHYRGHKKLELVFEPHLTLLVGENGIGKSTIGAALETLLSKGISNHDYPFGKPADTMIQATFALNTLEIETVVAPVLLDALPSHSGHARLRKWVLSQAQQLTMCLRPNAKIPLVSRVGELYIRENLASFSENGLGANAGDWDDALTRVSEQGGESEIKHASKGASLRLRSNLAETLKSQVFRSYRQLSEFRSRSITNPNPTTDALTGSETANVLFNLKNGQVRSERDRYKSICASFQAIFPQYEIEAVNGPDVQVIERRTGETLTVGKLSAGTHQILTVLANLVGREDLVLFVEHPEQHLNPHSMRFLHSLIIEASHRNQVIVTTHDPHFIDCKRMEAIRRLWKDSEGTTHATQIAFPDDERASAKLKGQLQTAFRSVGNREALFGRAVVLVEDESIQEFITGIAETTSHDLDANSISVIPVGGEGGFNHFLPVLQGLAIPYVAVRDKPWGNNERYPPSEYFAFGPEIEEYLDNHGLQQDRRETESRVGTSKRRVAGALGSSLEQEQVPEIFKQILDRAVSLTETTQHLNKRMGD